MIALIFLMVLGLAEFCGVENTKFHEGKHHHRHLEGDTECDQELGGEGVVQIGRAHV